MQVVLLRVGIDKGSGGILGPVFKDGSFEFVPIPDCFVGVGVDRRTYGNSTGRHGVRLIEYFPRGRRAELAHQPMHVDPEFETFTYGDPTTPKRSLHKLNQGDLLVFYAGLKGWDFDCPPALYLIAYFEVACAGFASSFTEAELHQLFHNNFHVKHRAVFEDQKDRLVLVKGNEHSRLLKKAARISSVGTDKGGRKLQRLSEQMQEMFGSFAGHTSIQRSPPRWVAPQFSEGAAQFVRSLE
jgi:hypothetical protein